MKLRVFLSKASMTKFLNNSFENWKPIHPDYPPGESQQDGKQDGVLRSQSNVCGSQKFISWIRRACCSHVIGGNGRCASVENAPFSMFACCRCCSVRGPIFPSHLFPCPNVAVPRPDHPHILRYFSAWVEDGLVYLQTEYCAGGVCSNPNFPLDVLFSNFNILT